MKTPQLQLRPNARIHELIEEQCHRTPDAIAVACGEATLTYRELDARASVLAGELREMGVGTEARVAIVADRSVETVVAIYAVLKAGGAYVPLDPSWPEQRIETMLEDSGAVATWCRLPWGRLPWGRLPAGRRAGFQPATLGESLPAGSRLSGRLAGGPTLAYVIYTSGSTGRPKGVLVPHAQLVHYTAALVRRMDLPAGTRYASVSTFAADLGHTMIFPSLVSGGTLHVVPSHATTDAERFADYFTAARIDCLKIVPSHLETLLATATRPENILPRQLLVLGGEAARPALLARVRELAPSCRVMNHYGPTETTVGVLTFDVDGDEAPLGFPLDGTTAHVLDSNLQPVAEGELFIGGASVARGYHERPDLTAERFLPDPFAADGARLYRTGDRVRRRADGALQFLGRTDHQVKIRGYRVELREIESALLSHDGVRAAVVVVRGDVLHAYGAGDADAAALRDHLRARLPEYMLPAAIVVLEAMPLTANGKIDRDALPAITRNDGLAPRDSREQTIADVFANLLGVAVGVEDNLLEAGGHSLLFMRAAGEIRRRLGVALDAATIFAAPTVAAIARHAAGAAPAETLTRADGVALSLGQQRMWIVRQLAAEPALYNVPAVLRVRGALDVAALERALTDLVARHDALRTVVNADGAPVVLTDCAVHIPVIVVNTPTEGLEIAREELRRPFDLATGPLLRAAVVRIDREDTLLVITTHHIASDAWSTRLLLRALAAQAEEPQASYADFAAWQRRWLASDEAEASLAYWRQQLAGVEATLELPLDRPRPAVQSGRGDVHRFTIDAAATAAARELARRENATPFMLLLATFHLLLHRITRQSDIVVGSPIAGRDQAEVENTIGFFVNSIALRATVDGEASFRTLLAQVRATCLGAYGQARMPFDRIVEALRPQRDLAHHPLFQVMFALQPAPVRTLTLGAATAEWLDVATGAAKFDLTLELEETEDGLSGRITYATDLFDAATIARMAGHYRELLANALATPDAAVASLDILTAEERALIVDGFNETAAEFPHLSLKELFEQQAGATPDRIAVIDGETELTYHELDTRANALALRLREAGAGVGTPVGVSLERSAELIVAILAIIKSGGAYVPLDLSYPEERLAFMVADSGMRLVVTSEGCRELTTHPGMAGYKPTLLSRNPELVAPLTTAESPAYIVYTSGSTGQPKGVTVPQRAVARLVFNTSYVAFGAGERIAQISSSSFDAFTFELWGALLHGATLVIFPRELTLSTLRFAEALRGHGITALFLTTALFNQHVREMPDVFAGLRHVLFGGEAVDPKAVAACLAGEPPQRLLHVYGPTESTTFASWHLVEDVGATVPIGKPLTNTTIYVLDARQEPVPVGVAGELFIGGDGLAHGYHGRPGLTAEKFVPNAFGAPGSRLYRTGDLVRFLPDGAIEFLGRLDDQVKIRGFRIELREVESVLASHPGVTAVAAIVREDVDGDRRLVAYVVTSEDPAELRAWLRVKLPEYMVPSALVVMDALPLNANGKVDRRALPAPATTVDDTTAAAPRNETERRVAAIWSEVLGIAPIGIHRNFFDLGGHSLLAVRVISRVRGQFPVELPLSALFEAPTIAALAEQVESRLWLMEADEAELEGVEL
jgi:amino acid adenylation domain-containing protein